LVRAARAEKVSFRQLHKTTGARVQQKLVAAAPADPADDVAIGSEPTPKSKPSISGPQVAPPPAEAPQAWKTREVSRDELVKGFEYEKDRFATLTKEELEELQPKTSRGMEIIEFVQLAEVDPIYFETSYYVIPESAGERPYALLLEALRKSGLVAVAQIAMYHREHVVIIRAGRRGMILHTMFYENEIRRLDEYRSDTTTVSQKELDMALMLVRALEAPFAPEKYRDTYREKLEALIQAKISGKQTVEAFTPSTLAPVVDIMEALKKSLEKTALRKPPKAEEKPSGASRSERPRKGKAKPA
jgi:DNA end-binding protein Ku